MALPTSPPCQPYNIQGNTRPYQDGANTYVIGRGTGGVLPDEIRAFKSTDPTDDAEWTEQDAAGRPHQAGNFNYSQHWIERNGDLLHMVTQHIDNSGHSTVYPIEYHRFNMGTDNWDVVNQAVHTAGDITADVYPLTRAAVTISVFSDDDSVIAFQDEQAADMGTGYARISYVTRTAAGSYGTVTGFSVPVAAMSYHLNAAVVGASDRVHFMFSGRDGDNQSDWRLFHQSLSSGGTLDTIDEYDSDVSVNICGIGQGYAWDDGGTVRVRFPRWSSADGMVEFDSGANPTITAAVAAHDHDVNLSNPPDTSTQFQTPFASAVYSAVFDTEYLVYHRQSDEELWYTTREGGGSWITDVTITSASTQTKVGGANVYLRDGSYKLAFFYDGITSGIQYDEIDLGNPGGSLVLAHPSQNNVLLRL